VLPLQSFAQGVVADAIRRQPASAARTTFAWQLAVGTSLARVTSVDLRGRTLVVRAADPRWTVEIERARGAILSRLQHLLGPGAVTDIQISS
jgi:hypothetical protein